VITFGRRDARGLTFSVVIAGRTLLEGEGRVGSRSSPQIQITPLFRRWWLSGVPVPVPPRPLSALRFAGLPIAVAIEAAVPPAPPHPAEAHLSSPEFALTGDRRQSGVLRCRSLGRVLLRFALATSALWARSALAQQPVRPLPKVGSCLLGWFSSGSSCVKSR